MNIGIIASSRLKFSSEFIAYNNAVISVGGALSDTQQFWLNNFIVGLKNAGLWNDLICFYPFLSATSNTLASQSTHSINMRNPGTYTLAYLSNASAPTSSSDTSKHFSTYYLIGGTASTAQVGNTGIIPSTAITNANSISLGVYAMVGTSVSAVMGCRNAPTTGATPTLAINPSSTVGNPYACCYTYNSGTGYVSGTTGLGIGYDYAVRRSTTDLSLYQNGGFQAIQAGSTNNGTRPTSAFYIGGLNNGSSNTFTNPAGARRISDVWIANRGFSASEISTFYSLELAMNTKLGR